MPHSSIAQGVKINLILVSLTLLSCFTSPTLTQDLKWSCAENVTSFEFDVARLAGSWYEVARMPQTEVPACVNVTAPAAVSGSNYELHVAYVNNVNSEWKQAAEELTFPWNAATKNGTFQLKYGEGTSNIEVTFKLVATNYDSVALVCGYSGLSTAISLFKVMSRERQINETIRNDIQQLVNDYGSDEDISITWVEQSGRCNGAGQLVPLLALLMPVVYVVRRNLKALF